MSLIRLDGKVVSDSNSYQKIERVLREFERKYELTPVTNSRDSINSSPTWIEHHRYVNKGISNPKIELQQSITEELENKPTTTEFINRLRLRHNIKTFPKLGADGVPIGVAFKIGTTALSGTAIGRGYTWQGLLARGLSFSDHDFETVWEVAEQAQFERFQSVRKVAEIAGGRELSVGDVGVDEVGSETIVAFRETSTHFIPCKLEQRPALRGTIDVQAAHLSSQIQNDQDANTTKEMRVDSLLAGKSEQLGQSGSENYPFTAAGSNAETRISQNNFIDIAKQKGPTASRETKSLSTPKASGNLRQEEAPTSPVSKSSVTASTNTRAYFQ